LFDRSVENVFQNRVVLQYVLREDRIDQRPIDPFVLDGHLAGHENADDRLAAATAGAAGAMDDDVRAAGGGDEFAELIGHVAAAGGLFAGGRSNLDSDLLVAVSLFQRIFRPAGEYVELLANFGGHGSALIVNRPEKKWTWPFQQKSGEL
jgi:hypothetical protein